ncbi:hypothetical protein [Streptomyces sp. NPDC020917]|uniref:hypothetical protein n=1 Tax=Streptomyces sp. NPDC020917 TaxID=3365102 RepID=UPI00379D2A81
MNDGMRPAAVGRDGVDRRTALGWGAALGWSASALAGVAGLTACRPGTSHGSASAVSNGETWLGKLASDLALDLAVDIVKGALDKGWTSWREPIQKHLYTLADTYPYLVHNSYPAAVPPAFLIGLCRASTVDGATDALLTCVNGGKDIVMFQPWARTALSGFVHDLTHGRKDADLAVYQSQALRGLIPKGLRPNSGASPRKGVEWMTYEAHDGWVEIYRTEEASGTKVTIKASAIWDAQHRPTVKTYDYKEVSPSPSSAPA